jgi:hypothetical protein
VSNDAGSSEGDFISPNLKVDAKFLKLAFEAPDLLGKVLRSHIEIEAQIDKLIRLKTKIEFEDGTEFSVKCLVLEAMGWPKSQLKTIRRFGTLRNKFAHSKPEGKTEAQINSLKQLIIREHGMAMMGDLDRVSFGFDNDPAMLVSEMNDDQKLVVVAAMISFLLGAGPDTHVFVGLVPRVHFRASQ